MRVNILWYDSMGLSFGRHPGLPEAVTNLHKARGQTKTQAREKCVCVCVCARECVHTCVRACLRACLRACASVQVCKCVVCVLRYAWAMPHQSYSSSVQYSGSIQSQNFFSPFLRKCASTSPKYAIPCWWVRHKCALVNMACTCTPMVCR